MASDDTAEPTDEEGESTVVGEVGEEVQEDEQVQRITAQEFNDNVRRLIDLALQSGLSPEQIQEELEYLTDGVPYYFEDIQRYTRQGE